jgi:VWFA-related protein
MSRAHRLALGLALIGRAMVAQEPPTGVSLAPPARALATQEPLTGASLPAPAKVVALNVTARDSKNRPVADLGIDDFHVTDQGKPQRIVFFHRNEDAVQVAPAGPHEYSNRSGAAAPHALVILLDLLNANLSYQGAGTEEIVRTLEPLKTAGEVYLYLLTYNGNLYPVHPLPSQEEDLHAGNGPWTQQVRPLLDAAVRGIQELKTNEELRSAGPVEVTFRALETLAAEMGPIPGRKDILWISQGVPYDYTYTPQLPRLATALEEAGISVNTVDQGNAVGTESKQTLADLANLTGGKAYPQRSVEVAVPEILASSAASYLIEYTAPPLDGKFHKIGISCVRKGVRIQAPQGYSAAPDLPLLPGYREAVVSSALDAAGIGIWAAVTTKAPGVSHLEIRIDSRDLMLEPQGDGFSASLNIILVGYTAKGEAASSSAAHVNLTRAQREKPSKDDILISTQDIPGGTSKVRIVVIDSGSNAIGSLTVPME